MDAPAVMIKKVRKNPYEGLTPEQIAEKKAAFVARMKEGKMRAKERRLAAAREPPNNHNDLADAQAKYAALLVKLDENAELQREADEDLADVRDELDHIEVMRADFLRKLQELANTLAQQRDHTLQKVDDLKHERDSLNEALAARYEHIQELKQAIAAEARAAAGGGEP